MTETVRIAAIQMVSGPRVAENLAIAGELVAEAVEAGARLVLLPEYFPIIGAADRERLQAREDFGTGPIQSWLAETAVRHGLWLVAGSIPLRAEARRKMRNSLLMFDPTGVCVARYDKLHLFSFDNGQERYEEALFIEPGEMPKVADTSFGRIALSICYDLRFPELYRQAGEVDLILMPAAFTETTGRAHWEVLLRARAIENQCYVLAAGQGGTHENGRVTHGNSMIVDPWGDIVARLDKGPGVIVAEFDPARIRHVRNNLPALRHRKL